MITTLLIVVLCVIIVYMWFWKTQSEIQTRNNYIRNMVDFQLKLNELEGEIISLKEKSAKDTLILKKMGDKNQNLSITCDNLGFYFAALATKLNLEVADLPSNNTWTAKEKMPSIWLDFYKKQFVDHLYYPPKRHLFNH